MCFTKTLQCDIRQTMCELICKAHQNAKLEEFTADQLWHLFIYHLYSKKVDTFLKICMFSVSGEHCEFDRRAGRCGAGVCHNGGTCRELSGGGFRCDCPAGGYEKPYCSVTTRSFPPKSFIMFRGLRQRFHLSVSLS